jgi:hypothetical protein
MRVHEAGHAVARYFTAGLLGWPMDGAVYRIELGTLREQIKSDDAGNLRCYQGTTFGHFLSWEMEGLQACAREALTPAHFEVFKRAGSDLDKWSFARYIFTLAGVIAEHKHTGDEFRVLLKSDAFAADIFTLFDDAKLVGRRAANFHHFFMALRTLCRLFDAPGIWPATLAVADVLKVGTTPGERIWKTFTKAMQGHPIPVAALGEEGPLVRVRRDWDDAQREAEFRLDQLRDFHWTDTAGGTGRRAPTELLHAYVWCSDMRSGDLAHSCEHGPGPHNIKVCVPRSPNAVAWKEIEIAAAWSMRGQNAIESDAFVVIQEWWPDSSSTTADTVLVGGV